VLKADRINKIHELIKERQIISLDELCDIFSVSKNTIRRDIAELDAEGVIEKVYGGIVLKESASNSPEPFAAREIRNVAEKKIIAQIAAALIQDGEVIYIDSGTTTMHLLPHLANRKQLTIVTANIYVIDYASRYQNLNVIATGGYVYPPSNALVGPGVISCIKAYNFSKIFLASTGISIEHGATNASPLECEIKQRLVQKSCPKYLLVDDSKLDVASLMTYCELNALDNIIMNETPPEKYLTYFEKNNVRLMTESK